MALTATLVNVTADEIVYLLNNVATLGTTLTIPAAGGATPDLVTDAANATFGRAVAPRLRQVARAGLDGLGNRPAGGWTQAQARDLLIANGAVQAGSSLMPRAKVDLQPVSGAAGGPLCEVDANVDGSGRPTLSVTAAAVAGDCILRISLRGT